jgi:hypothetical protein
MCQFFHTFTHLFVVQIQKGVSEYRESLLSDRSQLSSKYKHSSALEGCAIALTIAQQVPRRPEMGDGLAKTRQIQ